MSADLPAERKIAWQVNKDSSWVTMVEWEWETDKNWCYRREGGTTHKTLKHPVGTQRSYFPTWEEANAEVIRQAEDDLARTIESLAGKRLRLALLKKRTKKEAYEI